MLFLLSALCLTGCGGPKEVTDLPLSLEVCGQTFEGTYSGFAEKEIPSGEGTFTCASGDAEIRVSGVWEAGVFTGSGNMELSPFSLDYQNVTYTGTYSGEIAGRVPDGSGTFAADLDEGFFSYDGHWKDGNISGKGRLKTSLYVQTLPDGYVLPGEFEGEVLDGLPDGTGSFSNVNAQGVRWTYTGEWKDGMFNGHGRESGEDGYAIEGTFQDSRAAFTPYEYMLNMSEAGYGVPVADETKALLKELEPYFAARDLSGYEGEFDTQFKFSDYMENPGEYTETVLRLKGQVVQSDKMDNWGVEAAYANIQGTKEKKAVYLVIYCGHISSKLQHRSIVFTAVPLGPYAFQTYGGKNVPCILCAGIVLERAG